MRTKQLNVLNTICVSFWLEALRMMWDSIVSLPDYYLFIYHQLNVLHPVCVSFWLEGLHMTWDSIVSLPDYYFLSTFNSILAFNLRFILA